MNRSQCLLELLNEEEYRRDVEGGRELWAVTVRTDVLFHRLPRPVEQHKEEHISSLVRFLEEHDMTEHTEHVVYMPDDMGIVIITRTERQAIDLARKLVDIREIRQMLNRFDDYVMVTKWQGTIENAEMLGQYWQQDNFRRFDAVDPDDEAGRNLRQTFKQAGIRQRFRHDIRGYREDEP